MTAQFLARAAYAAPNNATKSPRNIEYEAFARVTHQLRAALSAPASNFPAIAKALHDNRTLWVALASDLAEQGNGLPQALRAKLFYLAEFTIEHSRRILAGQAEAGVLVEINTAVMRGLRREEDQR